MRIYILCCVLQGIQTDKICAKTEIIKCALNDKFHPKRSRKVSEGD
jgi:hypothetical protein